MGWNRRRVMMGAAAAITLSLAVGALAVGAGAQTLVTFPRGQAEVVTKAGKHHAFTVELATTHDQLTQGLMFRRTLAADAGMLFDFGEDKPVTMWMRNTLIPLDMLFVANDGRVVGIKERAVPQSSDIIAAPEPVRGVLELNGGTAQRLGLSAGDRVVHPMFERK